MNDVKRYRAKPIVVEAMKPTWDNLKEVNNFIGDSDKVCVGRDMFGDKHLLVKVPYGYHKLSKDDYIIKDSQGELSVYTSDEFVSQYEEIEECENSLKFNELAKEIHENSIEHGYWEEDCGNGEYIALMHLQLSELFEEIRKGHALNEIYYKGDKPEGVPIGFADCIIRMLDWAAASEIDVDSAMPIKISYNKSRPSKHDN